MTCGIYKFVNGIDGKTYIGSSIHVEKRRREHLYHLRRGTHTNRHFQFAWNQYGEDQFSFMIVRECDKDQLHLWEQHYINACDPDESYNLAREVDGKVRYSDETKRKMAETKKGKTHSEETKRKIAEAARGRKLSAEVRRKLSEMRQGRTLSAETKQKIGNAARGKIPSEETRQKRSESALAHHKEKRQQVNRTVSHEGS